MTVEPDDLLKVIDHFEASDWEDVHLRSDGFELRLSSAPRPALALTGDPDPVAVARVAEPPAPYAATTEVAAQSASPGRDEEAGEPVPSPSLGIFWRSPSPEAPPFVEVGDHVEPSSTLCIVEVMKLMTQVGPQVAGRVTAILVTNGENVVKGQPLFMIDTDPS